MQCPHCQTAVPNGMMGELIGELPDVCPGVCGHCANFFVLLHGEAVPLQKNWQTMLEHSPVWPLLQALQRKAKRQMIRRQAQLN